MKRCHQCKQEYEDWVEYCTDCRPRVRLAAGGESPPPPEPVEDEVEEDTRRIEGTKVIPMFDELEVEEIEAHLDQAGVPHHREFAAIEGSALLGAAGGAPSSTSSGSPTSVSRTRSR